MLENCKLSTLKMQTFRLVGGQKSRKIANVIVMLNIKKQFKVKKTISMFWDFCPNFFCDPFFFHLLNT